MIDAFYQTASAFSNLSLRQQSTANNVANVNTDSFKSSRVDSAEAPAGGVTTTGTTVDRSPGSLYPTGNPEDTVRLSSRARELSGMRETSNTDIAREMVNSQVNSYGMRANSQVVTTQNAMVGSLLDIVS